MDSPETNIISIIGYERSRQEHGLERGDWINLVAYYSDDHGVVHFRDFVQVP